MKKMIIGIIIGGIIFGTIGVVASTTISSTNVTYQNKTVKESLDELYNNIENNSLGKLKFLVYGDYIENSTIQNGFKFSSGTDGSKVSLCTNVTNQTLTSNSGVIKFLNPIVGIGQTILINLTKGLDYDRTKGIIDINLYKLKDGTMTKMLDDENINFNQDITFIMPNDSEIYYIGYALTVRAGVKGNWNAQHNECLYITTNTLKAY